MVSLHSFVVAGKETRSTLANLLKEAENLTEVPSFLYIFYDANHDDALIHSFLAEHYPNTPVLGGTSCGGVMSEKGVGGDGSIGLLAIVDPDGDYGVAAAELSGDISGIAERTLLTALENAGCAGELPELIWVYQAPGQEELVLEGLMRAVGNRCPIIGGSSADQDVTGNWRQMCNARPMSNGLVVGVFFSSGGIGFAFQGGYEPAGESGVITKVAYIVDGDSGIATQSRGRTIMTIDDRPAAEVYNEWTGGIVSDKLSGGTILAETTMFPFGIDVGKVGDVTYYLVVHPDAILENGAICTFADVKEGSRLFSMCGDKRRLIERADKVATAAVTALPDGPDTLAGGLMVYCAGCRMAIDKQIDRVSATVSKAFSGQPFLGCFTYGEQGQVLGYNMHGNLMISAITFGR